MSSAQYTIRPPILVILRPRAIGANDRYTPELIKTVGGWPWMLTEKVINSDGGLVRCE